jgi:hypothetical protein
VQVKLPADLVVGQSQGFATELDALLFCAAEFPQAEDAVQALVERERLWYNRHLFRFLSWLSVGCLIALPSGLCHAIRK